MKKALSIVVICALLLSAFAVFASASSEGLPFELVPPANVFAVLIAGESPTTTAISYSLSNEMTAFFKNSENAQLEDKYAEFISQYGIDDINVTTQVDWAVDDVNDSVSGWHCNEYWNADYGFGYDSDHRPRTGEWDGVDMWIGNATETENSHWVTRGVSENGFYGNEEVGTIGLKDQMRPDQYTYKDDELSIDYSKHTVYFRMRFVVTTYKDTEEGTKDTYYYSEWSNTAAVGKDAEKFEGLTEEDLPAPVITGLRMTDKEFNDNPVVAFTLTVPDELAANITKVSAAGGGIYIDTYARVQGDEEWTLMGNTDWVISAGERECALITLINEAHPNIPEGTVIELRCRYRCTQSGKDDIFSAYSKIISFGTDDINGGETSYVDGSAPETSEGPGGSAKDECWLCHFCPQPLGLCIFIWLLILIIVIIIIFVIVKKAKKNGENKK